MCARAATRPVYRNERWHAVTRRRLVKVAAGLMALVLAAALAVPAASAAPRDKERPAREAATAAASPDRAAARARQLTGGRVLGVQGTGPVYRVRVLEAGGRVRTIDIDTRNGGAAD